jgi:hypothetical protein
MQQGCPQPHEEVPSALETLLLESASYSSTRLGVFPPYNGKYYLHFTQPDQNIINTNRRDTTH